MPQFILIEQSLEGIGSHYFEYASHILGAAARRGFQPVVACHRGFARRDLFPADWSVLPIFPDRPGRLHRLTREFEYSAVARRGWWDNLLGSFPVVKTRLAIDRVAHLWRPLRYARRLGRFYRSCRSLFQQFPLADGDQVLLGTMGDLDLLGLRRFLVDHPWTGRADWHLQFHYAIFQGRDPDYPSQIDRAHGLKSRLENLVQTLPQHRIHFYTTTDNMARQYNVLDAAPFRELPYPVNPEFHAQRRRASPTLTTQLAQEKPALHHAPLRIACAGGLRREKGAHVLARIMEEIPADRREQVRFLVQSDNSWSSNRFLTTTGGSCVQTVPHPLTAQQYVKHICGADVGLLAYDSGQYWVRCSGILVEMLSAAVPVIVMAGNWLADQIARPIQRHLQSLVELSQAPCVSLPIQREGEGGWSSAIGLPTKNVSDAIVEFQWNSPAAPGRFVRVDAVQRDAADQICSQFASTIGRIEGEKTFRVIFRLSATTKSVHLRWTNAFGHEPLEISSARVHLVQDHGDGRGNPHGSVGLIAADPSCVPHLLCHLVDHYDHFQRSAELFSQEWHRHHHPDVTLASLLERAGTGQKTHPRAA